MLSAAAKRCHYRDYLVVFYRAFLGSLIVAAHYVTVGIDTDYTVQNERAVFSTVKRHIVFFQLTDGLFENDGILSMPQQRPHTVARRRKRYLAVQR